MSYFDKLSTLLMDIGRSCPRYQEFGLLYPKSASIRKVLCEYFVIVVQLCRSSILFLQKPLLSQLSSAIAAPFESKFGIFEKQLLRLATSIRENIHLASELARSDEDKLQALERKENTRHRRRTSGFQHKASQELADLRSWKQEQLYFQFLDTCSTYNHQTAFKQARKKGSTDWICQRPEYEKWKAAQYSCQFQCTGILGSGKTVLAANVIDDLILTVPDAVVAYFFCRFDETLSLKARTIVGSIARQLIQATTPTYHDSMKAIMANTIALDEDQLLRYMKICLPESGKVYFIILDGIDECDNSDGSEILHWIQELGHSCPCLKFYCSSRPNFSGQVDFPWQELFVASMSENSDDIAHHVESALEDCLQTGKLVIGDPALKYAIHNALVGGAQGMFLWLTFQLQSICAQKSDDDIIATLQTLPKDLPETFDRILDRIHRLGLIDAKLSRSIFEFVIAAQRPLTLEEIREALSVEPGETTWNTGKLINDIRKVLNSCGSLLVIDEELWTIHFAHHSIKQHLISGTKTDKSDWITFTPRSAERTITLASLTYLNFDIFNNQLIKLGTSENQNLVRVDIPSKVVRNSIPQSTVAGRLALSYMKVRRTSDHDITGSFKIAMDRSGGHQDSFPQSHSFLAYAQEFWLYHTRERVPNIHNNDNHKRYSGVIEHMFKRLVNSQISIVKLPWTREEWLSLDDKVMKWIIDNRHQSLPECIPIPENQLVTVFEKSKCLLLRAIFQSSNLRLINHLIKIVRSDELDVGMRDRFRADIAFLAVSTGSLLLVRKCFISLRTVDSQNISPHRLRQYGLEITPLRYIKEGSRFIVTESDKSWTLLSFAVAHYDIGEGDDMFRFQLEFVRDSQPLDGFYWETPFYWPQWWLWAFQEAACRKLFKVMDILLEYFPGPDFIKDVFEPSWSPLCYAVASGYYGMYYQLIDLGCEPYDGIFGDESKAEDIVLTQLRPSSIGQGD